MAEALCADQGLELLSALQLAVEHPALKKTMTETLDAMLAHGVIQAAADVPAAAADIMTSFPRHDDAEEEEEDEEAEEQAPANDGAGGPAEDEDEDEDEDDDDDDDDMPPLADVSLRSDGDASVAPSSSDITPGITEILDA